MDQILANIAAQAGTLTPILYGLFVAALLDTVSGLWAAFNSGTFNANFLAEFVRSHILQRIFPIFTALLAGVAIGGTDTAAGAALIAAGAAGGAAYLGEVVKSIMTNLSEGQAKVKGLPKR